MGKKEKILVIDDEKNLRVSLSMILERAGYVVTVSSGSEEALEALELNSFDLVFLDLNMPGMNGIDLLPVVLNLYPRMPVLILTGNGSLETAQKAVDFGVKGYLLKPINPYVLLERVSQILKEERLLKKKGIIQRELKKLIYELNQDV
jgi:DNA-binding NtrC family response regulator